MAHIMEDLGRAQQRLGRDAPPVQADAAQQFALDDRSLETELRSPDRRDIAAGPGAEDDEIVGVSQGMLLLAPLPHGEREGPAAQRREGEGLLKLRKWRRTRLRRCR